MGETPQKRQTAAEAREARLKAALKANMARRKAQARARSQPDDGAEDSSKPQGGKGQSHG